MPAARPSLPSRLTFAPTLPSNPQANFDHAARFKKALLERWGEDFVFGTVCFDYFYIPTEWANTRWGTGTPSVYCLLHGCEMAGLN